jgi:hypothetical protein
MKQFLLTLFCIISTCVYSQYCNDMSQFPGSSGTNVVKFVSSTMLSNQTQLWTYTVNTASPLPSYIFLHNPCVNLIESGIIKNGRLQKKRIIDHTFITEPLLNDYGWKIEFYSDTIYFISDYVYDIKPMFISMKYGTLLVTDTMCGPDCSMLNLQSVSLIDIDKGYIQLSDPTNSTETFELKYSINAVNWETLSYITSNSVFKLTNLRPGIWYLIAKNSHLESNIIRVTVSGFNSIYSIDELGRRTLNDPRSIKPNIW